MDPVIRPRSSVLAAWFDGWRRVFRAPWVILGWTVVGFLAGRVAWPVWPALDLTWIFKNDALSFGGSLDTLYVVSTMQPLRAMAFGHVGDFLGVNLGVVLTLFLTGGAIDRLARARPVGAAAYFGATGDAFMRFLRVSVVLGGLTWLWLDVLVPAAIAETPPLASTTNWLQPRALTFIAGLVVLVGLGIVGDYTRVRLVVEDRRSALGALGAGWRFVWRRPLAVCGLAVLNFVVASAVTFIARAALLSLAGTGETPTAIAMRGAVTLAVLSGLAATIRLGFMGATVSYFQAELAHAGYTARPLPTWPNSPAAEAIANLEARARAAAVDRSFRL